MAIVIVVIAALIASIVAWSRSRFDRRAFWIAATLMLAAATVNTVNQWPLLGMRLSTTVPVTTQVSLYLAGILLTTVLSALLGGLLAGVASFAARAHVEPGLTQKALWIRGAGAALFVLGVEALLGRLSPAMARTHLRNADLGLDGDDNHGNRALLAGSLDRGVDAPAGARRGRAGARAGRHGCRQRR